jgi:hypothetical protein
MNLDTRFTDIMTTFRQLKSCSVDFMSEVVTFIDERRLTNKGRCSWESIHHRYKALPNQSYISKFE